MQESENEKETETSVNILVVDDDAFIVAMLEDIFAKSKTRCNVLSAGLGAAAMDLILKNRFDIALIDIWLPDVNGLEIMAKIKVLNPETVCHVITSQDDPGYALQANQLGVDQFIQKPFTEKQILALVQSYSRNL